MTIRLLIVDDHPVVRDGLRGMFADQPDFEVVAEAPDGAMAVERAWLLTGEGRDTVVQCSEHGPTSAVRIRRVNPSRAIQNSTEYTKTSSVS